MRLNVRCCCLPVKILGTLEVTKEQAQQRWLDVPLRRASYAWDRKVQAGDEITVRARVELKIFCNPFAKPQTELAVYSDDRPVEFWRGIPGFIEAK